MHEDCFAVGTDKEEELVFQCETGDDCKSWVDTIAGSLSIVPIHLDNDQGTTSWFQAPS